MPPESWSDRRAEFLDELGSMLDDPWGIAIIVCRVLLGLASMAGSGFLLVMLWRSRPHVPIPRPEWGGADVALLLLSHFLVPATLASLALMFLGGAPPTELGVLLDVSVITPLAISVQVLAGSVGSLGIGGAVILLPRIYVQPLSSLGIGTGSLLRGLGDGALVWACGIPGGFALLLGWMFTLTLLGIEPDQQMIVQYFQEQLAAGNWAPTVAIGLAAVIIAPVVEELLFRAALFRWLASRYGLAVGVTVSALVFGLVHASLFAMVPITVLGAVLALLYHRTGNLWSCIGLHAVFNAGQFALMILIDSAELG